MQQIKERKDSPSIIDISKKKSGCTCSGCTPMLISSKFQFCFYQHNHVLKPHTRCESTRYFVLILYFRPLARKK